MKFEPLPPVISGLRTWGCRVDGKTFVVSYDSNHPDMKYRASWSLIGQHPQFLGRSFETREQAVRALRDMHGVVK